MKTSYNKLIILILIFWSHQYLSAQNWLTDFETAKKIATDGNKKIVLVFSGSDWCAPCIKLEDKIWKSKVFQQYAQEHYVMLRADFPRKKRNKLPKEQQEKNNKLAEMYNPDGYFPYVVILNAEGKVLGTTGFDSHKTPQDYIQLINAM